MRKAFCQAIPTIATLLLILAPQTLQTQTTPNANYRSAAMGLTFSYPASYKAAGSAKQNSADAEKLKSDCSAMPLAVQDMRTAFNMIFVKRIDLRCLGTDPNIGTLEDMAAAGLDETLRGLGSPEVGPGVPYEIHQHDAAAVSGIVKVLSAKGNNQIMGVAACVHDGKNVACFQFLSNDCETLRTLASSTIVTLDGTSPVAVVPIEINAPCYP